MWVFRVGFSRAVVPPGACIFMSAAHPPATREPLQSRARVPRGTEGQMQQSQSTSLAEALELNRAAKNKHNFAARTKNPKLNFTDENNPTSFSNVNVF